ncbi:MAG: ATP-binding cassette domain-containing protein [Methylomarinum sp.]|nr:ATP-binding cassette domain-containing protein [Methylomarinum sp.]
MPIIEVNHLTKEYQLGHITSLKETALNTLRRLTFQPTQERERFKALDDVNFHINEGEVVGIIGHNGAGKSTLLKHLANISKPTKGEVIVRGSVAPLIEVGAGVNPELTGRENIFLNGAILGIPKKIIRRKLDEIIEFSELERFIDTPVKRYSSGMKIKLGFSIATSMDADILIVDEVLAVGDLAFQRKCFDRMENLIKNQGKTVLLVSHNIRQIQRLCNRCILLSSGKIIEDAQPKQVCDIYYAQSDTKIQKQTSKQVQTASSKNWKSTTDFNLIDLAIIDHKKNKVNDIPYLSDLVISIKFHVSSEQKQPTFGIGIHTTDFLYLTTHNSEEQLKIDKILPGDHEVLCKISHLQLLPGVYSIRMGVTTGTAAATLFYGENLINFTVKNDPKNPIPITQRDGFFALNATWKY